MSNQILVIGAHPDDAEFRAGGLTARATANGHTVKYVSMTDGSAGHHEMEPDSLAIRRCAEAASAAAVCDIEYDVRSTRDGHLRPTLEEREAVIRLMREFEPDLVLTHRPNDYHPDHRYTAQLVRDAAFMVMVPNVCADTPPLTHNPAIAYLQDDFSRPYPFDPELFVAVDPTALERKYAMIACHESQTFEWLPYLAGILDQVPSAAADRRGWLARDPLSTLDAVSAAADRYRDRLREPFGPERAAAVDYVEAFELSEYGGDLSPTLMDELFMG